MTDDMNGASASCDRAMNRFLALDKGARLPFPLTLHLLGCVKCRTQVRLLTLAERAAARPLRTAVSADDAAKTVCNLPVSSATRKSVTLTNWIVSGVLMVCFMLAVVLLMPRVGSNLLSVYFYLTFAGIVTAYCALFVGANMDFFVKKIKTLQLSL